jgi:predicted permease
MMLRRAATRLYSLALKAFPSRHRANYAAEMVDTFDRALVAASRDRGAWHALRFAGAAWVNALSAGFGERRRYRLSGGAAGQPFLLGSAGRDLIQAVRSLAKARAFTLVCVTSLGVGMGTVIAILMLVRAIIGTPEHVNPRGLVEVLVTPLGPLRTQAGGRVIETWSYPDFVDLRDANTGVAMTGWTFGDARFRLREGDAAARVPVMFVSANYFTTVGVRLARGPGFDPAVHDAAAAEAPPVVVGHRFWQDRLGADPDVIGSTIALNRTAHVVVGVVPAMYRGHLGPEGSPDVQLWVPLSRHPRLQGADSDRLNREADWVHIVGRLSPGTTLAQASAAVGSIMTGLAKQYPQSNQFKAGSVEPYFPMGAGSRDDARGAQAMFFGLSGLVLFVVCLNISGMMMVRSATRERELALRQAIGASRPRLIQYILSEAVVLAVLGGTLAVGVIFGIPALLTWWFEFWHPDLDLFVPDVWVYMTCVGLCFVTSVVFGLLPAIRFSRPNLVSALKDEAGSGGGRRVGRIHRLTAALQAGLAVPFLVIGGVKLDQVRTTAAANVGFETKGLFAASVDLVAGGHAEKDAPFLLRAVQENLGQASGVQSVTVANGLPLDFRYRYVRVGREGAATLFRAHTTRVGERFFETMGIRLLRGRGFTRDDRNGSEPVVVLSEPLALQLYSGSEPVGQRLEFAMEGGPQQVFTVVGVTTDLVTSQMGTERPQLFVPLAQHPAPRVILVARASASDGSMASAFKNAVVEVDPEFLPTSMTTGDRLMRRSRNDLTVHSLTAVVCASVALSLTALGVYGVVGLMVASRTREIGVRMALGASRPRVLGTVLVDAMKVVLPGVAGGLLIAILVATIAGLPSARRAARVDPLRAMRAE